MLLALFTGIVAGVIHVLSGPDHLAAVAPFAARRRYGVWKAGFLWGLGHTWSVWLIAAVAVLLKTFISLEPLSNASEMLVGFTLIAIGLMTLRRALSYRVHFHEHGHDDVRHAHFHVHDHAHDVAAAPPHEHSHAPLGIGMLHGIAGSAHLVAVLPALALPSPGLIISYVLGYGLGTVLAMTTFAWAFGRVLGVWMKRHAAAYNVVLAVTAVVALVVGIVWVFAAA